MSNASKIEKEARDFMAKRLSNENRIRDEAVTELFKLSKEIKNIILSYENIRVSNIQIIVERDIKPLVEDFRSKFQIIMENSITSNFEEGYINASRLLQMATGENILVSENIPEIDNENTKEEILLLLLLYSEKLVDSLSDDLINNLEKDLTGIFITHRNRSENNNTINTILSGIIVSEYINTTLNNITNRVDLISRTETNRALNHGALFYYLQAQSQINNLLVKWVEIPDRRLCRFCKSMADSGTSYGIGVYSINDIQPPPLHPRCRCILVPYIYGARR